MLDSGVVDLLFPFGFFINESIEIIHLGPSFQKLYPNVKLGDGADKYINFKWPTNNNWIFKDLEKKQSTLILLEVNSENKKVVLRGQVILSKGTAMFLVSPWLKSPDEMEELGLTVSDFAIHDPIVDLIQIVQSHNLSLKELEAATFSLNKSMRETVYSMESLRTLIDSMPSGVLAEDSKRMVTHANQVFANIFANGMDAKKMVGMDCSKSAEYAKEFFMNPDEFVTGVHKVLNNKEVKLGEILSMKDGRVFERDYIPIMLSDGSSGHFWNYRDITELKKIEQKALEASRHKSDFLYTMSHEIRTPLNGIIGMTNLLHESKLNDENREFVEMISQSGKTLLTIINDVLDFSKIEAGKMELEVVEFDFNQFIYDILKPFQYTALKKGITLEISCDEYPYLIYGDDGRIGQIASNLVSNAIKFTKKGGVTVKVILKNLGEFTNVTISVHDTGIGIPEEAKARMFKAFSQAEKSISRHFGGTGLGLSISKRLVEMMAGKISFESEYGSGTTFSVDLTLKTGKENEFKNNDDSESVKDLTPKIDSNSFLSRILVAEDNSINQMVIGRMLERMGYKYQIVANGNEVLDALRNTHFDLILMDCQMPDMDGYLATQIIRKSETLNNDIPIIALTANAVQGDEDKCRDSGMNDYLSKPVDRRVLEAVLKRYLMKSSGINVVSMIDRSVFADLEDLQVAGEPDFVIELIDTFLKTSPKRLESISDFLKANNVLAASKDSHALKSSARTLGAKQLSDLCQQMENLKDSSDLHRQYELFEVLKKTYEHSCNELNEIKRNRV
jgi:signal transduction histidine kinase/DNA-binding response OmpR family regulator